MRNTTLIAALLSTAAMPLATSAEQAPILLAQTQPGLQISPAARDRIQGVIIAPSQRPVFVESGGPTWVEWRAESGAQIGPQILTNPASPAGQAFVETGGPTWVEWRAESGSQIGPQILTNPVNPAGQAFVETGGPTWVEWQAESGSNLNGRFQVNPASPAGQAFVETGGPTWVEWRAESGSAVGGQVINPGVNTRDAFERNRVIIAPTPR